MGPNAVDGKRVAGPLDFFSENLVPWQIEDVRRFQFTLCPRRIVNTNDLLRDAQNLRNRGLSIQTPETTLPTASQLSAARSAERSRTPTPATVCMPRRFRPTGKF